MEMLTFYAPETYGHMLSELRKIPFAKTDDGYIFAYWVFDLNYTQDAYDELLLSENGDQALTLLNDVKKQLKEILITEDDYLAWTVHKKEIGGVEKYHKVIHDLSINLLMLTMSGYEVSTITSAKHKKENGLYTIQQSESYTGKLILNRNNPFADVTIENQQFFYKTADGSTETLFFDTNNIMEKVDRNGKDMITMRPGFTVTKEHGVVQKPMQKVTFSSTMTEPIVGDEDHIYIHID